MYKLFIKRILDIIISFCAIIIFSPIIIITGVWVRFKLGSPIIFSQKRFGKNMKIITYHKFRTMTNHKDNNGEYKADEIRLTPFGKRLRASSLDELPQLFDILLGKMSIVGPRPQTIENVIFMTPEQQERHLIMPGLTGWAQINGRNNTTWNERLKFDLEYIKKESFLFDCFIVLKTIKLVLFRENINQSEECVATFETMGEYLLRIDKIDINQYRKIKAKNKVRNE